MSRILSFLLKIVLLPVTLVIWIGRLIGRGLARLLRPMGAKVDSSPTLSKLIKTISSSMANQRGLLLLVGTGLVFLSLIVHMVIVISLVATHSFDSSLFLLCLPFALFHVGVLVGFAGIMMAVPLGQGYTSRQE